jgi:hypothetical protein
MFLAGVELAFIRTDISILPAIRAIEKLSHDQMHAGRPGNGHPSSKQA